jgi:hypothetical protein
MMPIQTNKLERKLYLQSLWLEFYMMLDMDLLVIFLTIKL